MREVGLEAWTTDDIKHKYFTFTNNKAVPSSANHICRIENQTVIYAFLLVTNSREAIGNKFNLLGVNASPHNTIIFINLLSIMPTYNEVCGVGLSSRSRTSFLSCTFFARPNLACFFFVFSLEFKSSSS